MLCFIRSWLVMDDSPALGGGGPGEVAGVFRHRLGGVKRRAGENVVDAGARQGF